MINDQPDNKPSGNASPETNSASGISPEIGRIFPEVTLPETITPPGTLEVDAALATDRSSSWSVVDAEGGGELLHAVVQEAEQERRTAGTNSVSFRVFTELAAIALQSQELLCQLRLQREQDTRRKEFLAALLETRQQLEPEKDTVKLSQAVARQGAELLGYPVGCLYGVDEPSGHVVLMAIHGRPHQFVGDREGLNAGLAGRVAGTGQPMILVNRGSDGECFEIREEPFKVAIAAPLRRAGGEVGSVLIVADSDERHDAFVEVDGEILALYAEQASTLVERSVLWNFEQKMAERSMVLARIKEYMGDRRDTDKVLAALLLGVTAAFGLKFNRAAVFLLDMARRHLVARLGVGDLNEIAARETWKVGMGELEQFLQYIDSYDPSASLPPKAGPLGSIPVPWPGPLNERVSDIRIPVEPELPPFLTRAAAEGYDVVHTAEELTLWPTELLDAFDPHPENPLEPRPPLLLVPLQRGPNVFGFVVADNAFSRDLISLEDVLEVMDLVESATRTLAFTAALVAGIPERRALPKADGGPGALERAWGLPAAHLSIVRAARTAFNASSAVLWSYDPSTRTFVLEEAAGLISASIRKELQHRTFTQGDIVYTHLEIGWFSVASLDQADLETRELLQQLGAQSCQGVTLTLGNEQLGALFINYTKPRSFDRRSQEAAESFAARVAVRLKEARVLDQVNRVRETARNLARLSTAAAVEHTLQSIADETVLALECEAVTLCEFGPQRRQLRACARSPRNLDQHAGPPRESLRFRVLHGNAVDEDGGADDTDIGPGYSGLEEELVSCLGTPLRVRDEQVGEMYVNYDPPRRLTHDEQQNIRLFADQAAVAIHNAQLHEQKQETIEILEAALRRENAATALAGLGIMKRAWGHRVHKFAPVLDQRLARVQSVLEDGERDKEVSAAVAARLRMRLDRIAHVANAIRKPPVMVPPDKHVRSIPINAFIRKLVEFPRTDDPPGMRISLYLEASEEDTVWANSEWLREAFEVLANNAASAMRASEQKVLTIATRRVGQTLQIDVSDTGHGISPELRPRIGKEPIPSQNGGMGWGLVIAQSILERYHGYLEAVNVPEETPGATVRVSLLSDSVWAEAKDTHQAEGHQ